MAKIVFLGNGSPYSEAVFDQIMYRGLAPVAAAVPFYGKEIEQRDTLNFAVDLADLPFVIKLRASGCNIIWAPAKAQQALLDDLQSTLYDYMIVACWPYLLKPQLYSLIKHRALNLHPSLLPRFPGPDPLGEQLKSEDKRLGVTIHLLDEYFDQGPILSQSRFEPGEDCLFLPTLEKEIGTLAGDLVVDLINNEFDEFHSV